MQHKSKDGKYIITTNDSIKISEKSYFYKHQEPETHEQTRKRLIKIEEIGMTEYCFGEFGIAGIMSGLYIEMIWNYSDEDFNSYIDWVKSLIDKKNENNIVKSKDVDNAFVDDTEKVINKPNKS